MLRVRRRILAVWALAVPQMNVARDQLGETRLARARRMLREEMEFEQDLATAGIGRTSSEADAAPGAGSDTP